VERTGSGSCHMTGFGTSGVEPLCSGKCKVRRTNWIQLAQDTEQWRIVAKAVVKLRVM
jgi:hypothetical protein